MKLTFAQWLRAVDAKVGQLCGMSYRDLPDYCYADAYADGVSPALTAKRVVRSAMEDM